MNKIIISFASLIFIGGGILFIHKNGIKPDLTEAIAVKDESLELHVSSSLERGALAQDDDENFGQENAEQIEEVQVFSMKVGWSDEDPNIGFIHFDADKLSKFNIGDKIQIISEQSTFSLTLVNLFAEDSERDIYNFIGEDGSDSFIINSKSTETAFLRLETAQISVSEYLVEGRSEFYNLKDVPQGCSEIRVIEEV